MTSGPSNYRNRRRVGDTIQFPRTETFSGFNKPCRLEAGITDLEIEGILPNNIVL